MSPRFFHALGIDVGGAKIAGGIVRFPVALVRARRVVPTEASRGGAVVLDAVGQLATELSREARA